MKLAVCLALVIVLATVIHARAQPLFNLKP